MTEEELNESIIKNKIQGICQDCIYLDKIIPIINQMLKEEYIKGLEQGKLDKEMEKQQLISWLEDKIKECMDKKEAFIEGLDNCDLEIDIMKVLNQRKVYQEVLDFVNKGGKE